MSVTRIRAPEAPIVTPWVDGPAPADGSLDAARTAAVLLAAAGCPRARRRALLATAPPWATADRYDAPGKSAAYAARNPARTARELGLLARVWPGRPGELVLDLPCGAGRLLPVLRERFGARVLQADGSLAMLREAAARGAALRAQADALALPFECGETCLFRLAGFAPRNARVDAGLVGGDGHHRSLDAVGPSGFSGSRMRLRSSGSSRGGRAPRRKRFFRRE